MYERVNSVYKIELRNDEEAVRFYKLIKALFILETEFPNKYKFDVRISENGGLEFLYTTEAITKTIDYEGLARFIKEEYSKNKLESEELNEKIVSLSEKLENLKAEEKEKEAEYHIRQKQVTTYLECKKSFLGKIKYFFKGKKKLKEIEEEITEEKQERESIAKEELVYDNKEYYTIEDLIDITKILERVQTHTKNTELDIKALEASIERLTRRIKNAKSYIEEIEEHKKSIFEFWKFVNDDTVLRT